MPSGRVRRLSERALQKGLECRGAGPAHRWCGKEDARCWLSETVKETSRQTYSVWRNCTPTNGNVSGRGRRRHRFRKGNEQFSCSSGKHVAEAREWASNLDSRAENVRKACLSFPSETAIGLDQHAFADIAPTLLWNLWTRSSDNV